MPQVSAQCGALFVSPASQRAPQAQPRAWQMTRMICGIACAMLSDSSSVRVTACSISSRRSIRMRWVVSLPLAAACWRAAPFFSAVDAVMLPPGNPAVVGAVAPLDR